MRLQTLGVLLVMLASSSCIAFRPLSSPLQALKSLWGAGDDANRSVDLDRKHGKHKHKRQFYSPKGLFIQERASKQLPGPGQHFSFGALASWEHIHSVVENMPDTKLVFLVRHGQAVSNFLSETLGPDEWFVYEERCSYTDKNSTYWGIFDAELTELGKAEAAALNAMLNGGGWYSKLTSNKPTAAIVSPLSRCLQTCAAVMDGLWVSGGVHVEENVRETLGEDTCDARRAVSDPPPPGDKHKPKGPCDYEEGLRTSYPGFSFPVIGEDIKEGTGFGLQADEDPLWTQQRETQGHQTRRATRFLNDLFAYTNESVAFVVTHSGFTRSVLLAVGREPYRPQNSELVPVIIQKLRRE